MTFDYLQSDRARVARCLGRLRARADRLLEAATADDDADDYDLGYYYGAGRAHLLAVRLIELVLREGDLLAVHS